jgi:hypothetical protein
MTAACWLRSAAQCADMSAGLGTVMTRDELYKARRLTHLVARHLRHVAPPRTA